IAAGGNHPDDRATEHPGNYNERQETKDQVLAWTDHEERQEIPPRGVDRAHCQERHQVHDPVPRLPLEVESVYRRDDKAGLLTMELDPIGTDHERSYVVIHEHLVRATRPLISSVPDLRRFETHV